MYVAAYRDHWLRDRWDPALYGHVGDGLILERRLRNSEVEGIRLVAAIAVCYNSPPSVSRGVLIYLDQEVVGSQIISCVRAECLRDRVTVLSREGPSVEKSRQPSGHDGDSVALFSYI